MSVLVPLLLWSVGWSAVLAVVVWGLGRWAAFQRRPALMHWLWFGVLLRLMVPAIIALPLIPATSVKLRLEADFAAVLPQNISVDFVPIAPLPQPSTVIQQQPPLSEHSWANWPVGLLVLSLSGTVGLLFHWVWRVVHLTRMLAASMVAPQLLIDRTESLAREFRLVQTPAVLIVHGLSTPAVLVSWKQATILLPKHLLEELDDTQWSCILAHEVAHIARGDHRVNVIAAGVLLLYWWNPVAWWAWRELRFCQEASCDALALTHEMPSRRLYAETLLHVVEACHRPALFQPHVVLSFGDRTVLTRRFEMIANPTVRPRTATVTSLCLATFALTFFCLPVRADKKEAAAPAKITTESVPKEEADSKKAPAALVLKYDDDTPDGKKSIAGTGEMIRFEVPDRSYRLDRLRLHCARYGMPNAPKEDVKILIVSEDEMKVLHTELVPYSKFKRGDAEWTGIAMKPPVVVPEKFWVIVDFNAERTKGIYLSFDSSTGGKYSKIGLPGGESKPVTTGGDWMIQAFVSQPKP